VTAPTSAFSKEVQIMPKSRKTDTPKAARKPARKSGRKSARSTKHQRSAARAASSQARNKRSPAASGRSSKKGAIVALLERPDGAAISDLTKATGWQVHSVRAALTGLRNEGKEVLREKDTAGVTHYRLAAIA
jgi:Protein of unknown function (DUF3489)